MPNNVKVLLVDDNPMVLELLHGALKPLAAVTTSSDTADALLKAVDDPPDLDKLIRAVGDACKDGGLIRDDALIVRIDEAQKCVPGARSDSGIPAPLMPGVFVRLRSLISPFE